MIDILASHRWLGRLVPIPVTVLLRSPKTKFLGSFSRFWNPGTSDVDVSFQVWRDKNC